MSEAIKVIGDILESEMELQPEQILLTNQKWDIPTAGLFIVLSYVSGKAIGNNNFSEPTEDGMQEVQETLMHHLVQIDIMSFDSTARTRKEDIIQALRSIASQQAQEENTIQIARMPSDFINISNLEETAFLNRFTMTIAVTELKRKVKALASYFDEFQTPEVTVNE